MSTQNNRSRRDFLVKLTSVVGGGAAAIAASSGVVRATTTVSPSEVESKPATTPKGYQHTEHVETYYRLADF